MGQLLKGEIAFKPTVYIETTIPSYLTAKPSRDIFRLSRQSITQQWWDVKQHEYSIVTSDFTIAECRKGDPSASQRRIDIMDGIPLLRISEDVYSLSNRYMELLSIPEDSKIDTLHLSVCVVNQIDFLLTWNCKHLGPFTMQRVQRYNERHDYFVPILTTPETFFEERELSDELF
jgi:hypothetical protein